MRILVTGGSGFIGTNLVKQLCDKGDNVISLDNYSSGYKEYNLVDHAEQGNVRYHEVDVADTTYLDQFLHKSYFKEFTDNIDYVVHLAALPRIQFSIQNPDQVFRSNMVGLSNILNWCKQTNTPLVFAGTSSVHGDKLCNPYTGTKWMGEQLIEMYCKLYYMDAAVMRFYNVYGDPNTYQDDYGLVMTIFERQYANNEPLTITGDGEQRRDFTHVYDIVSGLVLSGEKLVDRDVNGQFFELGSGENYSINELADAFGEHPKVKIPKRPGEMRETLCTDTLANELLGWEPKENLIKWVKETI